ncbi:MAG: TonB-dependent receptor, partial [Bacteroidetes bacterium]
MGSRCQHPGKMSSNFFKISFILIGSILISAQWGYGQNRVAGIVRDGISGELLIGANVIDPIKKAGTATDNNGYFSLVMDRGSDSLLITYVGYAPVSVLLSSGKDTILNVFLQPGEDIEEVEVVAFKRNQFNESSLSNKELKYIPSIGSEPDVLKTLQLLPGIQTTNEGSSNLTIRGGGPGENLFLFDNVPLYYVNHLGGFVSVFNPDMINNVRVLKGGFPAKYGGKLSSVIDISMREGNPSKLRGTAGIGVMGINGTI